MWRPRPGACHSRRVGVPPPFDPSLTPDQFRRVLEDATIRARLIVADAKSPGRDPMVELFAVAIALCSACHGTATSPVAVVAAVLELADLGKRWREEDAGKERRPG